MTDDDAKRHLSDGQREIWDLPTKAGGGTWRDASDHVCSGVFQGTRERPIKCVIVDPPKPDGDYIAAAHPTAVLALLRELARKTAALERLSEGTQFPDWTATEAWMYGPIWEQAQEELTTRARAALAPPPTEGDPA